MKRLLLSALCSLLPALPALAILDTNNNGLSDLWEKQHHSGALFPSSIDPQDDTDQDGWTNAQEAESGTNPFMPNPPDGMVRPSAVHIAAEWSEPDEYGEQQLITPGAITVTWPTLAGKQYTLNFSPDLTQGGWLPVGSPFLANGGVSEYGFYNISGTEKLFWRVVVEDADSDNDGLTNHEEYLVGSNPNLTDSDGDNLPDAWEVQHSLDPNDAGDANADPDQDGLNNSEEAELQTDPNNSDSDGDHILDGQDAVPTDGEINWERTPEFTYVWIPQVSKTGATAVSKHGHILFPGSHDGINDIKASEILWDSQTSDWINMPSSSIWEGSGLLEEHSEWVEVADGPDYRQYSYTPATIDWSYDTINSMNDAGVLLGKSISWPNALMRWKMTGASNEYGSPTYHLASTEYQPVEDTESAKGKKHLKAGIANGDHTWGQDPIIADDGTISDIAWGVDDWSAWVVATPQSGQHSSHMTSWHSMPIKAASLYTPENVAVMLDWNTGMLYDRFAGEESSDVVRYRDAQGIEMLEVGEQMATPLDIGRTHAPPGESIGRIWFSAYHDGGNAAFIEKSAGGSGASRWHKPGSMANGAIRLNARGEAITIDNLWRNGTYTPINDLVGKPDGSDLNITKLIDLASNGIILAEATEGGTTRIGLLLPVEVVSADKFLAGSFEIPEGWDSLELEFVGPSDENLGKYGQLLGGGSIKIYDQAEDILSESDIATGGQSDSQKVWFVKDSENERKINFYTCFNSLGEAEIKLYLNGTSTAIGSITQELKSEQTFADVIVYVDDWVKGRSFYLPDTTTPPLGLMAVPMAEESQSVFEEEGISNLTRAALIPFFNVINQVEGMSSLAIGLFDSVRNGVEDDWEFVKLVGQLAVDAGTYAHEQALAELQKWRDDPVKRASEIKQLADKVCEDWVFEPMQQLREDLTTWEGFKRRAWQTIRLRHQLNQMAWTLSQSAWSGIVDGLTEWADDFCDRMMSDSEKLHWDSVPWEKEKLLAEINSQTRLMSYTFGYTFGYLSEQVAVGALSAGSVKVAQVATKGGVSLAGTLAKRTAANLAARAHLLKRILAEATEELSTAAVMAYQRGLSLASTGPTGPGFDRCAMEIMQQSADAGRMVWREYIDNILGKVNIRQFVRQGSEHIIERQTARLMEILGDDFSTQIARNFLKVADEVILVPKADGSVDDVFEAFFKAFEGNPSLMNHADDVSVRVGGSLDPMSANAKATLKKFLSDPNAGKLWEIDVPAIVDNEPAIPHNYWVRGILGELAIFKRSYKAAGYDHFPTAPAFDIKSAAEYVQIKTLKNPDGAYGAMKKAVDALAGLPPPPSGPAGLKLHILKKPGSGSDQLEEALLFYINNSNDARVKQVQVIIQEFELVP